MEWDLDGDVIGDTSGVSSERMKDSKITYSFSYKIYIDVFYFI